jgi:cyclopropane fatty-acyl-phospholipid synthase-like methyltransferase
MDERKQIVRAGYDRIGTRYLDSFVHAGDSVRVRYLEKLLALLDTESVVLELGCGAGIPVTQRLTDDHRVIGVDISMGQLRSAQASAPKATLIHADMTSLAFKPGSFDAIAAFYSITHLPREEHAELITRFSEWVRPNGLLLATMGFGDDPGTVEDDWLGAPMFFSSFDDEVNRDLVTSAGFSLVEAEMVSEREHDGKMVSFLWVIARRGVR